MRHYLITLLVGAMVTVGFVGAINWTIDPYWIWKSPLIVGINEFKPAVRDNIRTFKLSVSRLRPEIVILGTSRADDGIDPKHPAFQGRRTFNLAAPAQPYEESLDLFMWAAQDFRTKSVVLTLDFFVANAYRKFPIDFQSAQSSLTREIKLLLSLDTLVESVRTVKEQKIERIRSTEPEKFNNYREDGLRVVGHDKVRGWGGHRNGFLATEKVMLESVYLPRPKCAFSFRDAEKFRFPMEALRTLFAEAHKKGIDLKLAISPTHARLVESIAAVGLWDMWESWKRQIVEINEAESAKAGRPAFPLWDFSGYNNITTEKVPEVGDVDTRMQWYWESSHYKKETGDLMLDVMFGYQRKNGASYPDFGSLMTRSNIEIHLRQTNEHRLNFIKRFTNDVAEIQLAAERARLHRQSFGCGAQ